MALDDFMESEIGVAVAATAAATSPRARNLLRKGAVYGLAGAMKAGDFLVGTVRSVMPGSGGDGASPARSSSSRTRSSARSGSRASTRSGSRASSRSGSRRTTNRQSTSSSGNG